MTKPATINLTADQWGLFFDAPGRDEAAKQINDRIQRIFDSRTIRTRIMAEGQEVLEGFWQLGAADTEAREALTGLVRKYR